jgi:Tol biopolymer transport system component/DNA-binding winged helix-turn-helix (wHTH) protein
VYNLSNLSGRNMSSQPAAQRVVRFGLFELDLAAGELKRQGRKIKLQDQPLQVLELLLRRPGEIVTREELQQALWPADTFVEFDQGLNTAIKKIRLALGDSADNPRFVETIPRKGYRFIAPVEATAVPAAVATRPRGRKLPWAAGVVSAIVVASGSVWLVRMYQPSGPVPVPVPLTSYPGDELSPSFSPDGNHVAFAWNPSENMGQGKFNIYIKLIGGGDPVRLTHDPADEFSPAWSPDGRFIAYLRTLSPVSSGVLVIPAIGGAEHKVGEIYQDDPNRSYMGPYLSWSPDGKWLVAGDKESPKSPYALVRMSVEPGEKQRLFAPLPESFGDWNPAVSPDGSAVVFSRCVTESVCDLYLVPLSRNLNPAGEPKRLTLDSNANNPVWMPGGQAIVFSAGPVHTPGLWKLAVSRPGKPDRLAFAGESVMEPAISPQGRLAYRQMSLDLDICRLELNGGRPVAKSPTRLISSTRVDHEPRYSPDGKRIAFCSNRSGSLELLVCNGDGSNATQLTSFGAPYTTAGPRWTPDGRLIAFISTAQGKQDAYVISSEGGKPKRLAIEGFVEWSLSEWSHDGKWLYFGSNRTGEDQLWKTPWPIAEHSAGAVQVTAKSRDAVESPDGKYLYYLKVIREGNDSLWRLPLADGKETQVLASLLNNNFALVPQGIYFVPDSRPYSIRFLNFSTGKEVAIANLPREPAWGFSVSPDGRWLLYSEYEAVRADLMLVDNFQ